MINEILKYVNYFFDKTKEQHTETNDVILKSSLVYQYLYHKHFKSLITIEKVLTINDYDIGLIGPGDGCITFILQRLLGRFDLIQTHGILHDAFGRFYNHHKLDRGYTYALPEYLTSKRMKRNPLCGQIIGLLYCSSNGIII